MKPSEIRDKNSEELAAFEKELREQLVKLRVAKATQRAGSNAQFARIKRDIARVKTIMNERRLGIGGEEAQP
jgi:large subunit ribosomal protein L29